MLSVAENMIDEIINIFKNASFDVVVFEDLDRFKEPKILEELRIPDDMELVINIDGDQVGIYKLGVAEDDYVENKSVLEIIADC